MATLRTKGHIWHKNDPGFDAAVLGTMFNALDPGRRPEMMVMAQDTDDVIAAVRYARSAGLRISVCSGGHSWSANHLRNGSLLINMKQINQYSINREAMTAVAGPGVGGSVLLGKLMQEGLFFPAGHCKGVCIGGYLLQGGFAWNGRKLGMACESVIGLDIVTADGELVHANEHQHADLYWAARGAGGGFFGVVVQFHLKLYPRPKYNGMVAHVFGMKHLEHVFNWAYEVGPGVSNAVELQLLMSRKTMSYFGPGIEAVAPVFADSREELAESLAFMRNSPIKSRAYFRSGYWPLSIGMKYRFAMSHYPDRHHWGVDNMWTHADVKDLMPYLRDIAATLPPAPAHLLWLNWHPPVRQSKMAFSVEDKVYIALYGAWKSGADTPLYENWASGWMERMAHLSSGIQLADEGLHKRPARFLSAPHLQRMDAVRAQHDPQQRFHEWHSRPVTATANS